MFKKNEGYKQKKLFSVSNNLSKKKQKLWDKSKEHRFFTEVFCKIEENIFAVLYSNKLSRPNVPVNQMVGALILKHLYNWTYEQLFTNLNFNILTRHAIGIDSMDEEVFCEASIFNFQNKLLSHFSNTKEDLIHTVFSRLTSSQLDFFEVDGSVQRGDSFLIGSNIIEYSRVHLLVEIIIRLLRILEERDLDKFKDSLNEYTKFSVSNYVTAITKENLPHELDQLAKLYFQVYIELGDRYIEKEEYKNFKRVLEESFDFDSAETRFILKAKSEMHSGMLMSPDDTEATFHRKVNTKSKGYTGHISETVNPENKINLITDIAVFPNNIGDAEILENQLPSMIKNTPNLQEYFVDGQYGSYAVDKITNQNNIKLYQKAIKGRPSSGGVRIEENELSEYWVSCKGGQNIKSKQGKGSRLKVEFDVDICGQCPFNKECKLRTIGGKIKTRRRVFYFNEIQILAHKRFSNLSNLDGKKRHSRANVEATVKEMKRGMKNGKVRIRGFQRITIHMVLTAIGINFTRIWARSAQTLEFNLMSYYNPSRLKIMIY